MATHSLKGLVPSNTANARVNAVNAFKRWVASENVPFDHVLQCISKDSTAAVLEAVMDKFGVFLAFDEGDRGRKLAKTSVIQYYRQTKNWILEVNPHLKATIQDRLQKMAQTLDKYCKRRESGNIVKKSHACTKDELKMLTSYIYKSAMCLTDYQDAATLILLWHCFGRASDLEQVQQQHLGVAPGGVLTVTFVRIKTTDEQALSLFPDAYSETCPLLACALALLCKRSPHQALLSHLPQSKSVETIEYGQGVPLVALLDPLIALNAGVVDATPTTTVSTSAGVHAYINRVLKRVVGSSKLLQDMTSHSFRQGGAQHANADKDQKIAKVLSGWPSESTIQMPTLEVLSATDRTVVDRARNILFANCSGLASDCYNVARNVLDLLMAALLAHFPNLRRLNSAGPVVVKVEQAFRAVGVECEDVLLLSLKVMQPHEICISTHHSPCHGESPSRKASMYQQDTIIKELVSINKALHERLDAIEERLGVRRPLLPSVEPRDISQEPQTTKRRKAAITSMAETWFEWYTATPRPWLQDISRQAKSEMKAIVGYMKLFIEGMQLIEESTSFREDVLRCGILAQTKLLEFVSQTAPNAKSRGTVLREMRRIHRSGALNHLVVMYQQRQACGKIVDPTPKAHMPDNHQE
ncbi:hypothetical protein Ae201684P_015790 [Aphanomyces euteiches]|nr:hypothetical protein Ae201684P_015790 [Aphanomyces euteiches]